MNSLENLYDIAIVGSGPASFSASIYASRYRLKNIIFGRQMGGTISDTHKVCNYPGVSDISGLELATRMYEQTKEQGAEISLESVKDIKKENNIFKLITDADKEYYSKTVIIATGTKRNKIALPREELFLGKGLSYCATCDGMFYKDKVVAVIGGSNAATMAASMLSDIAEQVYIIYRGTELRGEPAWIEVVETKKNITVLFETLVIGLEGTDRLERVKLSKAYKNSSYLDVDGVFVEIGSEPNIVLPMKLGLELDERQYIKVEKDQSTNIEGIWAAGDCTTASNDFRQVVTAVAEGAIAANSIYVYLREHSIQSH